MRDASAYGINGLIEPYSSNYGVGFIHDDQSSMISLPETMLSKVMFEHSLRHERVGIKTGRDCLCPNRSETRSQTLLSLDHPQHAVFASDHGERSLSM